MIIFCDKIYGIYIHTYIWVHNINLYIIYYKRFIHIQSACELLSQEQLQMKKSVAQI